MSAAFLVLTGFSLWDFFSYKRVVDASIRKYFDGFASEMKSRGVRAVVLKEGRADEAKNSDR